MRGMPSECDRGVMLRASVGQECQNVLMQHLSHALPHTDVHIHTHTHTTQKHTHTQTFRPPFCSELTDNDVPTILSWSHTLTRLVLDSPLELSPAAARQLLTSLPLLSELEVSLWEGLGNRELAVLAKACLALRKVTITGWVGDGVGSWGMVLGLGDGRQSRWG